MTRGAILIRWASVAQNTPRQQPVHRRRPRMDRLARGATLGLRARSGLRRTGNADVDPRRRKIVWDDGKRLSIEQSAERIHAERPDVPCDLIETPVVGWLEGFAPESYSERQLEELDRLTEQWLDDYERKSQAARK
jgi:hypothetical protein